MQVDDPVIGQLWQRWRAKWEPGQVAPDEETPELKAWLKDWPNLTETDGVLYRVVPDSVRGPVHQLLVPSVLRATLLRAVHDQWGHQGIGCTYSLLKGRCFWPGMNRHVREHIRKCFECTVAKAQLYDRPFVTCWLSSPTNV